VPALPSATATAGLPAPVATTDFANPPTTQSVDGTDEDGGPRKVKTLVVRPDGSVEAPAVADAANAAADAATQAAETAAGAATQAAGQPANMMPVPIPDGPVPMAAPTAPQQVAAADPAPAPAAESKYLVQVGAHKSQTEALANYADIQQKYPSLLGSYPPVVQKANVGGGSMYRLRVGPIASKSDAYKLCGDLKAKGTDCFVAVQ
jgi:cell division protein FtsN